MDKKKEMKSQRLKKLEKRFSIINKTGEYIEEELAKNKEEKERLRRLVSKEKQAIYLSERAKRLRSLKK